MKGGKGNDKLVIEVHVDDKGKPVIKGLRTSIGNTEKEAVNATKKMEAGFKKLWKSVVAGIAVFALITGAVKGAVRSTMEFEREFANVKTLYDTAGKGVQGLDKRLLELAGDLGSATELARGMYMAISAGQEPGTQALNFTAQAAKFAKANLVEMADAVDVSSTIVNVFGHEIEHVTDVLTTVIRMGKTTGQQLAARFGLVAATAKSVGIEFEELSAATISLTAGGVRTAQAITSLKAVISNVAKPTDVASKTAQRLGVQFDLAALKSKGLTGFLSELTAKARGNAQAQADLFGSVEAFNAIAVLTSERGLKKYKEGLDEIAKSAGATNIAFEKQKETLAHTWESIKNQMQAAAIKALTPALKDLAKYIKENKDAILEFAKGAITAITTIVKIVIQLGKSIWALKEPLIVIGALMATVWAVKKINLAITALSGVVAVVKKLQIAWASFTATFTIARTVQGVGTLTAATQGAKSAMVSLGASAATAGKALVMIGKAGLVAGALYAGVKAGEALRSTFSFLRTEMSDFPRMSYEVQKSISETGKKLGITSQNLSDHAIALKNSKQEYQKLPPEVRKVVDQLVELREEMERVYQQSLKNMNLSEHAKGNMEVVKQIREIGYSLGVNSSRLRDHADAIRKNEAAYKSMSEEGKKLVANIANVVDMGRKGTVAWMDMLISSESFKNASKEVQNYAVTHLVTVGEASKAVQEQLEKERTSVQELSEAYENLAKSVGIVTQKGMTEITKEIGLLSQLFRKEQDQLFGNTEKLQAFRDHLAKLQKQIGTGTNPALEEMVKRSGELAQKQEIMVTSFGAVSGVLGVVNGGFAALSDSLQIVSEKEQEQIEALETWAKEMGIMTHRMQRENTAAIKTNIDAYERYKTQVDSNAFASYNLRLKLEELSMKALPQERKALEPVIGRLKENERAFFDLMKAMGSVYVMLPGFNGLLNIFGDKTTKVKRETVDLAQAFRNVVDLGNQAIDMLSKFGLISESLAESLRGIVSGLGAIGSGFDIISKIQKSLKITGGGLKGFFDIFKKGNLTDIISAVSGSISVISGIASTVSSLVGAVVKLFKGDGVGEAIARETQGWMSISDEIKQQIRELEEQSGDTHTAMSKKLAEIMQQSEITVKNFGQVANRVKEIFLDFTRGHMNLKELQESMGAAWTQLVEEARRLGTEGSFEMLSIIREMNLKGLDIPEIKKYIEEQISGGASALSSYIDKIGEGVNLNRAIGWVTDYVSAWKAQGKTMQEIAESMGGDITKVIEKAEKEKKRLSDALSGKLISPEEALNLKSQIGNIETSLHDLYEIKGYKEFVENNRSVFESIEQEINMLSSLGNISFEGFEGTLQRSQQSVMDYYNQLIAAQGGAGDPISSQKKALEAIAPLLAKQSWYARQYNVELDATTKSLIEQASQMGINMSDYIPVEEKKLQLMEQQNQSQIVQNRLQIEMIKVMSRAFGQDIPEYITQLESQLNGLNASIDVGLNVDTTALDQLQNSMNIPVTAKIENSGGAKMSGGGSGTVPPGYPNDTFPLWLTTGERYLVETPAQQNAKKHGATAEPGRQAPVKYETHHHGDMNLTIVLPNVVDAESLMQEIERNHELQEKIRGLYG